MTLSRLVHRCDDEMSRRILITPSTVRISGKVNACFGEVEQAGGRRCAVYGL